MVVTTLSHAYRSPEVSSITATIPGMPLGTSVEQITERLGVGCIPSFPTLSSYCPHYFHSNLLAFFILVLMVVVSSRTHRVYPSRPSSSSSAFSSSSSVQFHCYYWNKEITRIIIIIVIGLLGSIMNCCVVASAMKYHSGSFLISTSSSSLSSSRTFRRLRQPIRFSKFAFDSSKSFRSQGHRIPYAPTRRHFSRVQNKFRNPHLFKSWSTLSIGRDTALSSSLSSSSTGLEWETFEFSSSPKWDTRFDEVAVNDHDSNNEEEDSVVTFNRISNDGSNIHKKVDQMKKNFNNNQKTGIVGPTHNHHHVGSNSTMLHQRVSDDQWKQIVQQERERDHELSQSLEQRHRAIEAMDPMLVQRAILVLSSVVQPDRYQRITQILQRRTKHVRFLFENPGNPSNVWACLRTLDSFGIQHVGIVVDPNYYERGGGKAAIVQKRGMRTAMGSAQWMTLHHYLTTDQAINHIRNELGYCLVASDVHEDDGNNIMTKPHHDIRKLPWHELSSPSSSHSTSSSSSSSSSQLSSPPICIVMGNERYGISDTMRQACDATFYLPMSGFAESFNLSVATAITCAHLSAATTEPNDVPLLLRAGDLHPHEYNCLLLKGLCYSFAQKRTAQALLLKEGLVLPPEIHWI